MLRGGFLLARSVHKNRNKSAKDTSDKPVNCPSMTENQDKVSKQSSIIEFFSSDLRFIVQKIVMI